jgi:hypothetical protein
MCSFSQHRDNSPEWIQFAQSLAWKHRAVVIQIVCVTLALAAVAGLLVYRLTPTDIQRAETDLQKAKEVVSALNKETAESLEDAEYQRDRAKHYQARLDEKPQTTDSEWVEWNRSKLYSHSELSRAKFARRNNLIRLTAGYQRLLAEAECEILRAKDASDRGTPFKVAPRVRDILAPILAAN